MLTTSDEDAHVDEPVRLGVSGLLLTRSGREQLLDAVRRPAGGRALLLLGEATVKTHLGRVLQELALRDRAAAVAYAYGSGLVRPGRS